MTTNRPCACLVLLALAAPIAAPRLAAGQDPADQPKCRLPVLSDEAAWQRLPQTEEVEGEKVSGTFLVAAILAVPQKGSVPGSSLETVV